MNHNLNKHLFIIIGIIIILFIIYYANSNLKFLQNSILNIPISQPSKSIINNDPTFLLITPSSNDQKKYIQDSNDLNTVYDPNDPNYLKENITQFHYKKLLLDLDNINNRKIIKLKGITNEQSYTQSTTRDSLRLDLDQITKKIIPILNSYGYDFSSTNYGDVIVWTDKFNNEEIKYELFLWDKKYYFEIKLWIHCIKFVEKKYTQQYGVKKSPYLFPTFPIGYEVEDQIIPDPLNVIISGNMSNPPNGICSTKTPLPIKYFYLNRIDIWNSTLVVNYSKNMYPFPQIKITDNSKGLSGYTDMSIYYSNLIGNKPTVVQKKAIEENKWPTLYEQPPYIHEYPCKNPPINHWNEEGIYYYGNEEKYPQNEQDPKSIPPSSTNFTQKDDKICPTFCPGTRWSSTQEPLQPNFWVSYFQSQANCGDYEFLFDNSKSLPGVFVSGGKK